MQANAVEADDRVGGGAEGPQPSEEGEGHAVAGRGAGQEEDQQGQSDYFPKTKWPCHIGVVFNFSFSYFSHGVPVSQKSVYSWT